MAGINLNKKIMAYSAAGHGPWRLRRDCQLF
ncbi:Uncharacterised protein [Escherichia coli]|uniref:Uncharacterized protein n=1 Tax=Escherichia coli TaxID=562 RepID=A0A376DHV0_ECOLX|nr:Uncharacterised protein [Escherichia coli]